nr:histone-lysine N-methyltransferase 2C-like [Gorilla gorilla gorilla]
MHTTVVLFSSSDKFTLNQDMCVVCGSFGQGAEGRLLACSQCGQCYHPYCVSIKKENLWIVMENQNLVLSGKLWMMKLREWKEQMVSKREKRKPYRPGIGGFMVRQRSRTGQGKTKRSVIRKDSSGSVSEQLPCRDDVHPQMNYQE